MRSVAASASRSSLSPLGRLASQELSEKFGVAISLDWSELKASDLSGRARAFQSMIGGGMPLEKAASLAGLLVEDDA